MVWFVPLFLYGGSAGEAGVLPALGLRWVVAVKAELFRFELSNFSCLQLLWKPHFPCLMVTDAASGPKMSNYVLLQIGRAGCLGGFTCVSLNTGTLHVCVCDANLRGSILYSLSEPTLPVLLFFSRHQNHKSCYCNSERMCAAGLSARNIRGWVAEGAWMNDWTEVNATKAVGGKRRLEIGSPTTLICSLQWCIQARRGWRGLYSPSHLNSMWFCLRHIFVSTLSLGMGKMPWLPVFLRAHFNFLNKSAAAPAVSAGNLT